MLSLLDHLSFNFFSSLAIVQILDHDVRPDGSFFYILDEKITAFQKIFLSFSLKVKHIIDDNACLMIILGYRLDTV